MPLLSTLLVICTIGLQLCTSYRYTIEVPPNLPTHALDIFFPVANNGIDLTFYETPIATLIAYAAQGAVYNCVATYSSKMKDIFTKSRPLISDAIPKQLYITDVRLICIAYSSDAIIRLIGGDDNVSNSFFEQWGLWDIDQRLAVQSEIKSCDKDNQCLVQLFRKNNFDPSYLGIYIALQAYDWMLNDSGFNVEGKQTPFGECTANCEPYSDPLGLFDPRINGIEKYATNYKNLVHLQWKPLLENDKRGFFFRQEHVTPHIGYTAPTVIVPRKEIEGRNSQSPNYNYFVGAQQVIEEVRKTATNDTRKMLIEAMDNKLILAVTSAIGIRDRIANMSSESWALYVVAEGAVLLDAVLLSWKEKIKWNLIRPTTVIQSGQFTDEYITTYGGPGKGVQRIKAYDFQPYIRVMPHSEFPSASGCICLALSQLARAYVRGLFQVDDYPLRFFWPAGSSRFEPGITPANDIEYVIESTEKLYEICRDSRVWGGMHFNAAIEESERLCHGLGNVAYDTVVDVINGENMPLTGKQESYK